MQQQTPDEGVPLLIFFGEIEVAGYFEQGRWIPVTFHEFVKLTKESASLSYLQPVRGFAGIEWHQMPSADVALPCFQKAGAQ